MLCTRIGGEGLSATKWYGLSFIGTTPSRSRGSPRVIYNGVRVMWWSQLVIGSLEAKELPFGIHSRWQTKRKISIERVPRLSPFPRCHDFSIEQPAIWHTIISSTRSSSTSLETLASPPWRGREARCLGKSHLVAKLISALTKLRLRLVRRDGNVHQLLARKNENHILASQLKAPTSSHSRSRLYCSRFI